jgi:hypothetical protein
MWSYGLWEVKTCGLVDKYQQRGKWAAYISNSEAAGSSETLVPTYKYMASHSRGHQSYE